MPHPLPTFLHRAVFVSSQLGALHSSLLPGDNAADYASVQDPLGKMLLDGYRVIDTETVGDGMSVVLNGPYTSGPVYQRGVVLNFSLESPPSSSLLATDERNDKYTNMQNPLPTMLADKLLVVRQQAVGKFIFVVLENGVSATDE